MMASSNTTELDLVEKVFLKIVLTESDDQLQTSLNGFLAPILLKVSSQNVQVKNKILELLNHINKRLRSRPKIQLPLEALIVQYQDGNVPPTVRNFTIIYIKMGYQRADKTLQISLIPKMLSCLTQGSLEHRNIILQNILFHINDYIYAISIEERKSDFKTVLEDASVKEVLLEYFSDFLLLPYNLGLDMKDPSVLAPPSLSKEMYSRLKTDPEMSKEQIENAKLGILKLLTAEMLSPEEIICHLIIGSSDVKHSVADKADHLIKSFSSIEMWQNKSLMNKLLTLYQGTSIQAGSSTLAASDKIRSSSSLRLKMKIFPYILKSRIVIDLNPALCLQVIFGGLFGDSTNLKIKQYSLEFIGNSCHHCSEKTMVFLAPLFYQALCRVSMDKKEDSKLRALSFSGFSKLAKRSPGTFKKDLGLVQKLLVILEEDESDLRVSIQDSLSGISHAFSGLTGTNIKMMESLILSNAEKELPALKLVALQFANAAFPSTHVLSRFVCLLCSADSNDAVREEANRGLLLGKTKDDTTRKHFYPKYNEVCEYFYEKLNERKAKSSSKGLVVPLPVHENLLTYMNCCLHAECDVTEQEEINEIFLPKVSAMITSILDDPEITDISNSHVGRHINLIKDCMIPTGGHNLHGIALMNLLELTASYPSKVSILFSDKLNWFETFLASSKESVRDTAARLISVITCTCPDQIIKKQLDSCLENIDEKGFEESHGCILAVSYILGRHVQFKKELPLNDIKVNGESTISLDIMLCVKKALVFFVSKLTDTNTIISAACCTAIGELGKVYVLPLSDEEGEGSVTKKSLVGKLASLLENAPESKVKEKAVAALGYLCVGDPGFSLHGEILDALIASSKIRQPELHFNIGEAISCLAAGRLSQVAKDKWIIGEKTPLVDDEHSNEQFKSVLRRIIKDCVHSSVSHVRQAAVVWLLCIVKFSSGHPALQIVVNEIQAAFIDLLSDSDDITQDSASRGLGLIYDLVKPEAKEEMVSILVDRLMSGKRAKRVVEDSTELFKPGTLGSDPDGGNLSTYKELCSLATSLNKPDLVYKFLNLANHNAMWNSRKGAAFGFLSISNLAGDQLKPYLVEIIPKLYRYQYDPNMSIRKAMTSIWSAIVPDGKKTVDKYTKEILKELLSNITSNVWRIRESCCLGLNDLIKSCPVEDVLENLSALWKLAFKVMDDIKESVRTAATILGKTMGRLSIRLCDVNQSKLGERAVVEVLPVLLDVGLSSNVSEVKALSLQTLVDVSKNAGTLLKPHIPKFLIALLESLSAEEPQYLNMLSLQLSQNQQAQEKLDVIRLSASKSSPMMDAIRYCIQYVDETVLNELVPRLCELLKTGVGLGTKVGCSTLVIQLTTQCRDTLTPSTGKLLATFLNGLNDRNSQIKKAYANAIGHLVTYSKESSIEKLLNKLIKWYYEREDESVHLSCAWCINAMGKYSPDKLNNFNTLVLPFVFIAKQGNDDKKADAGETNIQELWEEIWNNNTSGNMSSIKLYLSELYELIVPLLSSQSWGLRTKAAQAVLTIADSLGSSLQQPHLNNFLNVSVNSLQGRTWSGKENILMSISKICVKCSKTILEGKEDEKVEMMEKVIAAMVKECKKENMTYKLSALSATTSVIGAWKINKFDELKPIIETLLSDKQEDGDEDDDVEEKAKLTKMKSEINGTAFEALGKVWPDDLAVQEQHFGFMSSLFQRLDASPWKVQQHILKSVTVFVERTHWLEACKVWKNENGESYANDFVTSFIPKTCLCIEKSSYSSLKLLGVKFLITFYQKAHDCEQLSSCLGQFTERVILICNQLSSSSDCDISNNALKLSKLLKET